MMNCSLESVIFVHLRKCSTGRFSRQFFATVQNKMHYSVHGHTAAEIIYERADADKDFMGLTTWTGVLPTRTDAEYAKNYLSAEEIDTLAERCLPRSPRKKQTRNIPSFINAQCMSYPQWNCISLRILKKSKSCLRVLNECNSLIIIKR